MTEMEARELMRKELKEEKRLLIESMKAGSKWTLEGNNRLEDIEKDIQRIEAYNTLHLSSGRRGVKAVGILCDVRNVFTSEGIYEDALDSMVIAWACLMSKAIDKRFSIEEDGQQDLFTDVL